MRDEWGFFCNLVGDVKRCVSKREKDYSRLRGDLKNEKITQGIAEKKAKQVNADNKARFEKQKYEIKENQLKPEFSDLIQMEKEGKSVVVPNCIMLIGPDSNVTKELMEWTRDNSNCNFVKIKHTDDLIEYLEKAEENHHKTGNRTLIQVEDFDKLLNPETSRPQIIAGLKDIMSSTSNDYHSTIIFSTKNPDKLDQIALQPHRVLRINADIKEPEPVKPECKKVQSQKSDFDSPWGEYSSKEDYNERNTPSILDSPNGGGPYRGGLT